MAITRTQALNPAGSPLALAVVDPPMFVGANRFDVPWAEPAETTYAVAPGTAGQETVAVPATTEPEGEGLAGAAAHVPGPGPVPTLNENGDDAGPEVAPDNAVIRTANVPTVPGGIGIAAVVDAPTVRLATTVDPEKKSSLYPVAVAPGPVVHVTLRTPPLTVADTTLVAPGVPPPVGGGVAAPGG
jgi:hypothetical protein